jgi:multiple sugar transport system permease protein
MNSLISKLRDPVFIKRTTVKVRAFLFGASREKRGFLASFLLYFTLLNIAMVYIAPIVSMFSMSIKSFSDVMNPIAKWIPSHIEWGNYEAAFNALNIIPQNLFIAGNTLVQNLQRSTLLNTMMIVIPSTLLQVMFCSVAGYAFGRMEFPLKKLFFFLLILEFVVPPQAQLIPMIWTYRGLGMINTPLVFYAPALLGHGVKGALFVFIYMQFFRKLPKELEEAALIDGIGPLKIFLKIMMPLAKPAYMVVLLFSLVYHWTDSIYSESLYKMAPTFAVRIMTMLDPNAIPGSAVTMQTTQMAAGIIMMAPILIIYFFTQKTFTESIERTGLVE